MSILKTIETAKAAAAQPRAVYKTFYKWYDALSEEDRQQLDAAILSEDVSNRQLYLALKQQEGVPFGDNAFYHHVNALKQENGI